MSNMILTQIPAQATFKFYIIITQGCSANKKSVRTHPKNSHFKTASNSFLKQNVKKVWERRPKRSRPTTLLSSPQRNLILRLSRRLSNSSTKSSKSVLKLVPFNLKYINVTQYFTGNGISGKCFH